MERKKKRKGGKVARPSLSHSISGRHAGTIAKDAAGTGCGRVKKRAKAMLQEEERRSEFTSPSELVVLSSGDDAP